MADVSDVYNALAAWISNLLYPNGSANPSVIVYKGSSVPFRIYAGWPVAEDLDNDLVNGIVNVNIFPLPSERNISTLDHTPWIVSQPAATLTATVSNDTVTLGGSVTAGEAVGITVGGTAYSYLVQASDTLSSIALALTGKIPNATSSGAVVTVGSSAFLKAAVGVPTVIATPVKRQSRQFQIVVWAFSPVLRDQVSGYLDSWLGDTYRLPLPDLSSANLKYHNSPVNDLLQKEGAWRRDLFYEVIFDTTRTQTVMTVVGTTMTFSLTPA